MQQLVLSTFCEFLVYGVYSEHAEAEDILNLLFKI